MLADRLSERDDDVLGDARSLFGRTLGEFVVREPMSAGGFGVVFRAEQPALAREAVIKVLHQRHRARDHVVVRFLREAQLASRLDHPYAAHTYAFGAEPDGILWIAMELVRGTPLDRMLAAGPLPLERFVPLLERVCEVIQTAHDHGIVHRDLKPANVMVLARAGRLLPKLLDLGIARLVDPTQPAAAARRGPAGAGGAMAETVSDETGGDDGGPGTARGGGRLTEDGTAMGSPHYMAPEQWRSAAVADARTDQYALGVLCYEVLTGRPPFAGTDRLALATAHARDPIPPLGDGLPRALDAVLARAMAKAPDDRFATVLELAAAFRAASGVSFEPIDLPRLPAATRDHALASAPEPLAIAVAALEGARNPHQLRDAAWQVVRVAVRLLGLYALAAFAQVGAGDAAGSPAIAGALRGLRRRTSSDPAWLALVRALCRPFAAMRDAHPLPELVALACDEARGWAALFERRDGADRAGADDERVRAQLARVMPLVAALLDDLGFLAGYPLVVPDGGAACAWVGSRHRRVRARVSMRGRAPPPGQPILIGADATPVLALWPFVQVLAPSPGTDPQLFFFEGRGRHGGRLVAIPDAFEHDDPIAWDALRALIGDASDPAQVSSDEERCPFPGLAPYTRDDAAGFLGRERETQAFVNRLRVAPLLAVVGPSGAGKSSFVQAGVIAALPSDWHAITVRPGPAPLTSLRARLRADGIALDEPDDGAAGADRIGDALRAVAAARGVTVVLVVDQLEEVFTQCDDAAARARFVDALARIARSADDPVRVIVTLRDDFLLAAAAVPGFRTRLTAGLQLLTTPGPDDLRRILVTPIATAGYELDDPTLADDMVRTIEDAPGALALLSFTAARLWERRDRRFRQLGRKAYDALGGVGGALAQHADATLDAMSHHEQRRVREAFRHLVTAEGTRASVSRAELEQLLGGGPGARAVIEKLVGGRLLVTSETLDGAERIEVIHEALLDAWPRLVGWRREDALGARLRDQLRAAARQWEERGRPRGLLWRDDALAEFRAWRGRVAGALTTSEEAFAAASLAAAARGARVRRRLVAGAFVVLAAAAIALLLFATRADRARAAAEGASARLHDNLRDQYESQGRRLVVGGDPLQGLAYLGEAAREGAHGPAHDFLVAEAMRATDGLALELRHDAGVAGVEYAPDGERLLSNSEDGKALLWDAHTGALLRTLRGGAPVTIATWSGDGRRVVTTDADGTVTSWEAATGAVVASMAAPAGARCEMISPAGDAMLVASDGAIEVLDLARGTRRFQRPGGRLPIACYVSPRGDLVAAGADDGTTRVLDAGSGALVATLHQHGLVNAVTFSPDGAQVVTADATGTAILWDARSGRALETFAHPDTIVAATFSPNGTKVATASYDRTAAIWDAATGRRLRLLAGHQAAVNKIRFTRDGARVVTASTDATARLWDASSGRPLARWIGHRDAIRDVVVDPSGDRIATASADGTVRVWDGAPQASIQWLVGSTRGVHTAAFSSDGRLAVTGGRDRIARIWEVSTGHERARLPGHEGRVSWAAFAPDARAVATGDDAGTIRIWDVATGALRRTLAGHTGPVATVAWSPDGAQLLSASADGTARVWSAATGRPTCVAHAAGDLGLDAAAFTPAGDEIVTIGDDHAIRIWNAATCAQTSAHADRDTSGSLALDRDGRRVVGTTSGQSVRVWDLRSGRRLVDLVGHVGDTYAAAFSPDGAFVATGAADGTARLWDARSGDLLAIYPQGTVVFAVAFSPDGRRLLTTADDGSVAVQTLPRLADHASLGEVLRCRVPYQVVAGSLVPRRLDVPGDRGCPIVTPHNSIDR